LSVYYLDASVLVKRYVNEAGSDWIRSLIGSTPSPLLFTSRMTVVEVISAFARRARDGSLTDEAFALARDAFFGDCQRGYQVMPPTLAVISLSCALLERHPLRAYDVLHLATALVAQRFLASESHLSLTFLTADARLLQAAVAEGLAADDPSR